MASAPVPGDFFGVEYRVDLSARSRHLFQIEARFPVAAASTHIDLKLPVWTPGSYLIREFQRQLQELICRDQDGMPLAVRKVGKACFRVELGGAKISAVIASYQVYAHEVSVRTAHLDASHAFWNGANILLYTDDTRHHAARLVIDAPEGWQVATGLQRQSALSEDRGKSTFAFSSPDYDTLVDCPVEVGMHERLEFVAQGHPHTFAIWGRAAFDRQRLIDDVTAIIDRQAEVFGGVPYEEYTFLLHLVPNGYGGLEHGNSCALIASPNVFSSDKRYQEFLELVSHEYFHLWNGKRIRPAALGPFDYERENHTRSLWVVEGVTSYYDRLFLRRAGRLGATRYLEKLGEDLTKLGRIPGRRRQSLEESSFDSWIKLYRPDENTVNSTVSYYLKGSVVALLLDLEIRRRSEGAHTLDDVLRLMWARERQSGRGYGDEEVQALVEQATGLRLDDFFAQAVRGRAELDVDGPLASVGLRIKASTGIAPIAGAVVEAEPAWLGATLRQEGARLRVVESLDEGPAQLGHLYPADEIVACEGWRIDEPNLNDRLLSSRPGESLRLTVFRRDELRELTITLAPRPKDKLDVAAVDNPTDAQRTAYRDWLGEELTELPK